MESGKTRRHHADECDYRPPLSRHQVPILWHAADINSFPTNAWLTFKQALDKGGHVKKGEKATQIVFTKRISVKDDDDDDKHISMLKSFTVFNVAQVEGVDALRSISEPPPEGTVDSFVEATGADIRHGGDRACFVPSRTSSHSPT